MKKLFCVSLIKSITKVVVDLLTLKQKLIAVNSDASDPSNVDPSEYFIGNEKCADYLGVSTRTVKKYVAGGLLKSVHVGRFACYKKSDVAEAVVNVPLFKERFEAKESGKISKRTPSMTFHLRKVPDNQMFIYLSYQEWHIVICASDRFFKNIPYIEKLCHRVINIQHAIKPFRIEPNLI